MNIVTPRKIFQQFVSILLIQFFIFTSIDLYALTHGSNLQIIFGATQDYVEKQKSIPNKIKIIPEIDTLAVPTQLSKWKWDIDTVKEMKEILIRRGASKKQIKDYFICIAKQEPIILPILQELIGVSIQDILRSNLEENHSERLLQIMENTSDMISTSDLNRNITYMNSAGRRMLGIGKKEDLSSLKTSDFYSDKTSQMILTTSIPHAIKHGVWEGESELINRDGIVIPISQVIIAHKTLSGELLYLSTIIRDITEYKRIEQKMRLDESRLISLHELVQMTEKPDQEIIDFTLEKGVELTKSKIGYIAFVDEDEGILTMNSWSKTAMKECRMTYKPIVYKIKDTGLLGEAVRQRRPIITNDYSADIPGKKGCPEGHVSMKRHMNIPLFDGKKIVVLAGVGNKSEPYDNSDVRQLTLMMEGLWKILQRKKVRKAIKESEEKSVFLSQMSHDLRTPLVPIYGYLQLLKETDLSEQQAEYIQNISFAIESLLNLIDDILEFSKLKARKISLKDRTYNLKNNLSSLYRMMAFKAKKRGVNIHLTMDQKVPEFVLGDWDKLNRVIMNLVSNAIKYTSENGDVWVNVNFKDKKDKAYFLEFEVKDNGIGILPKALSTIFDEFVQIKKRSEGAYQGTGLGLTIAKSIVSLMQGTIKAQSEGKGKGTSFIFDISLGIPDNNEIDKALSPGKMQKNIEKRPIKKSDLNILIVEDNKVNQIMLIQFLKKIEFNKYTIADNGLEALNAYKQGVYDLILMDCQMPVMDGYESTKKILEFSDKNGKLRPIIIALTANAMEEDMNECFKAGMHAFITKPYSIEVLNTRIEDFFDFTLYEQSEIPEIDIFSPGFRKRSLERKEINKNGKKQKTTLFPFPTEPFFEDFDRDNSPNRGHSENIISMHNFCKKYNIDISYLSSLFDNKKNLSEVIVKIQKQNSIAKNKKADKDYIYINQSTLERSYFKNGSLLLILTNELRQLQLKELPEYSIEGKSKEERNKIMAMLEADSFIYVLSKAKNKYISNLNVALKLYKDDLKKISSSTDKNQHVFVELEKIINLLDYIENHHHHNIFNTLNLETTDIVSQLKIKDFELSDVFEETIPFLCSA